MEGIGRCITLARPIVWGKLQAELENIALPGTVVPKKSFFKSNILSFYYLKH